MTTAVVIIGNSDDKLPQSEWASFCRDIRATCEMYGTVHFSGGPETSAKWQNYCVCTATDNPKRLRAAIEGIRFAYKQESAAWIEGSAEFV